MTVYRYQVTGVGYWRGAVHRWHNTLHYSVTSDSAAGLCIPDLYAKLQALGYSGYSGGIAEIACYNTATGGVPVASTVYFDYTTPTSWIPFTGTAWGTTGLVQPNSGEECAQLKTQAGFSRTGKPVFVRLYWRAFGVNSASTPGSVQFSGTVTAAVAVKYNALQTLSVAGTATAVQVTPSGGSIAGSGTCGSYITQHQRTRGRRRTTARSTSALTKVSEDLLKAFPSLISGIGTAASEGE